MANHRFSRARVESELYRHQVLLDALVGVRNLGNLQFPRCTETKLNKIMEAKINQSTVTL